jgi:periplasmic protein TonB
MKYLFLIVIYLTCPVFAFSQIDSAQLYFKEAGLLMKDRQFREADSLLTRSINLFPRRNAFFNRALCNRDMGFQDNYCKDLAKAALFGDEMAAQLIITDCNMDTAFIAETINRKFFELKASNPEAFSQIQTDSSAFIWVLTQYDKLIMPQYPGGVSALVNYLNKNIRYPGEATNDFRNVYLTFIVNANGKISNIKTTKEANASMVKELTRVISEMPKWNPGSVDGIPVAVQYNLPFNINLK